MITTDLIPLLQRQLDAPLPGQEAHYKMAHAIRRQTPIAPADARIACVLNLLYPFEDQLHIVLIQRRATHADDRHSGQVSFPGGRYEPEDKSLASGAIREAQEEVGINPSDIQLLGRLTELYIPVSNFLVHPFVGFVNHRPSFIPQESEVAEILEVPLSHLLDPMNTRTTKIHLPQNVILSDVPYYHVAQKVVWGATAMMLSEFLEVVEAARPN